MAGFIVFCFISTLAIVAFFSYVSFFSGFCLVFSLCDGFALLGAQSPNHLGGGSPDEQPSPPVKLRFQDWCPVR